MIVSLETARQLPHHLGFIGVEPASEGQNVDASCQKRRIEPADEAGRNRTGHQSRGHPRATRSSAARRPARPRRAGRSARADAPLTKAAQAPEPQASVTPAPRSHMRSRIRSGERICAKPMLARCGNSGSCSNPGPRRATSTAATSSTKKVACGLPMFVPTGSVSPSRARGRCSVSHLARQRECPASPSRAGPMSTLTPAPPCFSATSSPATVWITISPARALAHQHRGDATCGIAAGLGDAAIRIADFA